MGGFREAAQSTSGHSSPALSGRSFGTFTASAFGKELRDIHRAALLGRSFGTFTASAFGKELRDIHRAAGDFANAL